MIYTTREININGSDATIDEDIYLFKQDSNIELKFILNNTKFTFQTTESTNVVESSNASYFRVKLLNPNKKAINFPIQEVTDNFIVLLITEELIDEDTEVGDYTIQIRLYDKDKNSKLTLPAITNCIHIRQPIFDEVEEGTVDTAAIDTASVMMSDEGELPVVDSTGKYIPTLWNNGDTISKAKINHIEKGILQAHTDALAAKIPHITPPKGTTTSDIVTFYNSLGESDFVTFVDEFVIDDITLLGLCEINSFKTSDNIPCKGLFCFVTGMYVNITSTGNILSKGITDPNIKEIMQALYSQDRKKGQVLTMINDDEYGWTDVSGTTPQLYVYSVTGSGEVQLTLDSYQIIGVKIMADLSSPAVTVTILLPMIEESDRHAYKIHVLLMGSSSIEYELPSGFYDKQLGTLQNGVVYELIYTYIGGDWVCHCIEYSNKISNAPV